MEGCINFYHDVAPLILFFVFSASPEDLLTYWNPHIYAQTVSLETLIPVEQEWKLV